MHAVDNILFPQNDTTKNKIMFENIEEAFTAVFNDPNKCQSELPVNFEFEIVPINNETKLDDALTFINKYYYTDDEHYRLMFDESIIKYFRSANNVTIYYIKFKTLIIALKTIEIFDLSYEQTVYRAWYNDFFIIHPKFRHSNIGNFLITHSINDAIKRGKCKVGLASSHTKLHFNSYLTVGVYNIPLSKFANETGICRNKPYNVGDKNKLPNIYTPSLTELQIVNNNRYKVQTLYSNEMLQAQLETGVTLTDGKNFTLIVIFYNVLHNFKVKTACLKDYIINDNQSFRQFMKSVINYLQNDKFDLLTCELRDNDDMISFFGFEKNSEMKYYMANLYPKVKRHEVMMTLR